MGTQTDLIHEFLGQKTIAVVGLSRKQLTPANAILGKLKGAGYNVIPVHPEAEEFEGLPCRRRIADVDDTLDGVMLATRPDVTEKLVDECIEARVPRIWMHNMMGTDTRIGKNHSAKNSSVSEAGVRKAREAGISVITGSCPMQFVGPLDGMHRCVSWFNRVVGNTR